MTATIKYSEKLSKMRAEKIDAAKKIIDAADAANRAMTAEESAQVTKLNQEAKEIRGQIIAAREMEAEEPTPAPEAVLQPRITQLPTPGIVDAAGQQFGKAGLDFHPRMYGRLRNATNAQQAYRFGMWACAVLNARNPEIFQWARKPAMTMGLFDPKALLSEGVNTAGGYLVPEEFLNTLIDLREKYGVFRRKAKIIPMTRDTTSRPRRTGGLTAYPAGEGAAGTESNKSWDRISLTAKKWMVLTRMSSELQEDAVISIGDDLMGEIAFAFAVAEDGAGFNGDGSSTYAGITGLKNALDSNAQMAQGTSNTWSAMVMADFNNLMAKVPDYTVALNPEFYCNKAFYHSVMERLAMAAGGVTATEIVNGVAQGRFFGYVVNFVTVMPSATATSGIMCYFGDLGAAADFGDRRQVTISMSDNATVGGESMWERDEVGLKGTERIDINIHERGSAATNRPIVALKTS